MRVYLPALLLFATFAWPGPARPDSAPQNWFHDPFFQISSDIPDCPMPAGPFTTEVQRTAEAHHRAERGTTCWLEKKCARPSSYDYDQDIASAFKKALSADNPFKDSTLWVTVQGRVVFIEGCAEDHGMTAKLEKFAMTLPFVEMAVAKIRYEPSEQPPYTILKRH